MNETGYAGARTPGLDVSSRRNPPPVGQDKSPSSVLHTLVRIRGIQEETQHVLSDLAGVSGVIVSVGDPVGNKPSTMGEYADACCKVAEDTLADLRLIRKALMGEE